MALDKNFFATLPELEPVPAAEAEMAWFVYDLVLNQETNRYNLKLHETRYTKFETALQKITRSDVGNESDFLSHLQTQLDSKLQNKAPAEVGVADLLVEE